MMTKLELLDKTKHDDVRLSKSTSFQFAKKTSTVAIPFSEFPKASAHYPIVLPEEGELNPLVVLSFVKDHNAFVGENGNWKAAYIPSYFRFYPFVLGIIDLESEKLKHGQEKVGLFIDRDAPHFESGMGEPLFTANGDPLDFILNIFESLKRKHQELVVTRQMFEKVSDAGILQSRELSVQVKDGQKIVKKFKIVDMEKLKQLDDKILADWTRAGIIAYIYDHVRSLSHFKSQNKDIKITLS